MTFSITPLCHFAEWRILFIIIYYYADCHYADCHYADCLADRHYAESRYAECHYILKSVNNQTVCFNGKPFLLRVASCPQLQTLD
jgi:hypothetical protein